LIPNSQNKTKSVFQKETPKGALPSARRRRRRGEKEDDDQQEKEEIINEKFFEF